MESGELKPKVSQTAMTLFKIYLFFTIVETLLLYGLGMTFFDALCHTFGTLATGGFSTKNASIGYYHSPAIEAVIMVFMILSAINFSLYFHLARGRKEVVWKNTEVKFFLASVGLITLGIAVHLALVQGGSFWHHLRESSFQVVSLHTCTGFATADYEKWTSASQMFLLFIMIIGGSLGSTAGGIKMVRFVVVLRYIYSRCLHYFHPKGTFVVRLNGEPLSREVVGEVVGLFCLWLLFLGMASLALSGMGLDMATSFSATITTMSGVGPGIGLVGPMDNFSAIPSLGKVVLIVCMLLGRLEIYTLLVIFLPAFWKQ